MSVGAGHVKLAGFLSGDDVLVAVLGQASSLANRPERFGGFLWRYQQVRFGG